MAAETSDDGFILRKGTDCINGVMPSGDLNTDLDEFAMALQELIQATKEYEEPENTHS